jgi:protein involved in polysaccharide export with SLBB domain
MRKPGNIPGLRVSVLVLLAAAGWALAQPAPTSGPAFKYYVWGQVRSPGAYSLGANPDIVELLSAAGGPTQFADVRHIVVVRAVNQKRMKVDLKKMLGAGEVVPLSPGDVVMVPNSPWYTIRDGLSITATVVSFATLVFTILNWMSR